MPPYLIYANASGIIEGSDDYANLKACMSDVAACMKKCAGGLWDKFEFVFLGGGMEIVFV